MTKEDEEDARIMAEIEAEEAAKNGTQDDDDDEGEEESTAKVDSEIDEAETDSDREEIRARRKKERKSRGERHREEVEALRRKTEMLEAQLSQQAQEIASINDVNVGAQLGVVDAKIAEAKNAAAYHAQRFSAAVAAADGPAALQAKEYMDQANKEAERLGNFKANAVRAIQTQPKQVFNSVAQSKIEAFKAKNPWFDQKSTDSRKLLVHDVDLITEGYKPDTDEYWAELERRGKKDLPHRFGTPTRPRNTTGGESRSTEGGGEGWKLSKERVQLMKDANIWNNPKERAEMIKYYRMEDQKAKRK